MSSGKLNLDQDHAAAGARQEVDLVRLAQQRARVAGRGDDHLVAGRGTDRDNLGARQPCARSAGPARVLGSTNGSSEKRSA